MVSLFSLETASWTGASALTPFPSIRVSLEARMLPLCHACVCEDTLGLVRSLTPILS